MQYRQLGHSGLLVSEIILGTVPFGGRAEFGKCGSVDVPQAKRMFDIAFDAGVNMVDTADLYSHGLAEEVVGQALAGKRNDILLATKVAARWTATRITPVLRATTSFAPAKRV